MWLRWQLAISIYLNSIMAKPSRRWLSNQIRKQLITAFEVAGFQNIPYPREPEYAEIRNSQPFGRLHRNSSHGIESVEIHLNKYGDAAFRLFAGVIPHEGTQSSRGHQIAQDVLISWLDEMFYAKASFFSHSFHVRRWFGKATEDDYAKLVARVVKIIPEIEIALRTGTGTSHMKKISRK